MISLNRTLYKTKFYEVSLLADSSGYAVTNRYTEVIEELQRKLPTAIGSAIAMNAALEKLMEKPLEESTDRQ